MYGYTGGYYMPNQQPMGQLEQLRMQQPQQSANRQIAPMIWVQGETGAKSYMVAPGNSVPLWDSERQTIYIKSCDASGMPSMRVLDYTERLQERPQPVAAAQPAPDYVTRAEFDALRQRVDALPANTDKEAVNDAKPTV